MHLLLFFETFYFQTYLIISYKRQKVEQTFLLYNFQLALCALFHRLAVGVVAKVYSGLLA